MNVFYVEEISNRDIADAVCDAMYAQSQYLETWPFMDWLDEAVSDPEIRLFGIRDQHWRGFLAYSVENNPVLHAARQSERVILLRYLYVGESSQNQRFGSRLCEAVSSPMIGSVWKLAHEDQSAGRDTSVILRADIFSAAAYIAIHKCFSQVQNEFSGLKNIQISVDVSLNEYED